MQQNILRESNITKIFLIYMNNGSRKREDVTLRFMDNKECYFSSNTSFQAFNKPKKKTPAEINVFTPDGVYKTTVTIVDTNVSLTEILYQVSIPKTWDFIQMRASTRKRIELPIEIKFNDGFNIEAVSYDLSLGGVSFYCKEPLSSIYKKITGILTLKLPQNTIIDFPEGAMTVETKFVREKPGAEGHYGQQLLIFKFLNIPAEEQIVLKNFLIKID